MSPTADAVAYLTAESLKHRARRQPAFTKRRMVATAAGPSIERFAANLAKVLDGLAATGDEVIDIQYQTHAVPASDEEHSWESYSALILFLEASDTDAATA